MENKNKVDLEQLNVKVEITNADEFSKLINETIDNLNRIKNFKFKTKVTD